MSGDGDVRPLTLLVRVCALAQQELDEPLAILDAGRYHERRPAYLVLYAMCFHQPVSPPKGDTAGGTPHHPGSAYDRT